MAKKIKAAKTKTAKKAKSAKKAKTMKMVCRCKGRVCVCKY